MNLAGWFRSTETDIIAFATKVWNEEKVLAKEITAAAKWIAATGLPALTADVRAITPFVGIIGSASGHPELAASMEALNAAMAGVQAFASAANSGPLTADQVVQGYGSLKQAQSAASKVAGIAATIVAVTPPEKPAGK